MKSILRRKLLWVGILLVLSVMLWIFWLTREAERKKFDVLELGVVEHGSVIEILSETGVVRSVQSVSLAFERGGRVAEIYHKAGDTVEEQSILIALDTTELQSEVTLARARLDAEQLRLAELEHGADNASLFVTETAVASARATLANAERSLKEMTALHNQLVINAEKVLRSSGLQAYLFGGEQGSGSYDSPTITGVYSGEEEGVYIIELYNSAASSGSSFRVSGLEIGVGNVSTIAPVQIGTRGLYVQFPSGFPARTMWEIPIPNTRSSSYLTNLNAYRGVIETRNVAVTNAQNAVSAAEASLNQALAQQAQMKSANRFERVEAQRTMVGQMSVLVAQAEATLNKAYLRSPFAGIVAIVNTEVGQIVAPNVPLVSMHSEASYELAVEISEVDIAEVTIGDYATVTFDAFEDLKLTAVVTKVAPSATVVSGPRTFTVTLSPLEQNTRLRNGLTAKMDITTAVRDTVIAVPSRAVYEGKDGKFVRYITREREIATLPVTTGLRGTNGMTEILSGLRGGEEIIMFASEKDLERIMK